MSIPNDAQCVKCSGTKYCDECSAPYHLSHYACCEAATYYDGAVCASCSTGCLSCTGSTAK